MDARLEKGGGVRFREGGGGESVRGGGGETEGPKFTSAAPRTTDPASSVTDITKIITKPSPREYLLSLRGTMYECVLDVAPSYAGFIHLVCFKGL